MKSQTPSTTVAMGAQFGVVGLRVSDAMFMRTSFAARKEAGHVPVVRVVLAILVELGEAIVDSRRDVASVLDGRRPPANVTASFGTAATTADLNRDR
jgi:hypothetical protein